MQIEPNLNLDPREQAMEAQLGRLSPAKVALDLGAVATEAYRRRLGHQLWTWRAMAAGLAAALLLSLTVLRPQPRTQVVYVQTSPTKTTTPAREMPSDNPLPETSMPLLVSGDDYFAVRGRLLAFGLPALGPTMAPAASANSAPIRAMSIPPEPENRPPLLQRFNPFRHGERS